MSDFKARSSPQLARGAGRPGAPVSSPSAEAIQKSSILSSQDDTDDSGELSGSEVVSNQCFVSHDPFEAEALDCADKWRFLLDRFADEPGIFKQREQLEQALKDLDSSLRRLHTVLTATSSEIDHLQHDQTVDALKSQIRSKMSALDAVGQPFNSRLRPRKFRNAFELETFYKENRPLGFGLPPSLPSPKAVVEPSPKLAQKSSRPQKTPKLESGGGLREQVNRRAKRKQSVMDRNRGAVTLRKARYHIVVDVSEVHVWLGQEAIISLSLYAMTEGRFVSEEVSFPLPSTQSVPAGKARVTFVDVPIHALEDLHLICRIIRIGKVKYDYAKAQQLAASATSLIAPATSSAAATVSLAIGQSVPTAPQNALTNVSTASGISSSDVKRPFAVAAIALSDAVEIEDSTSSKAAAHLFFPSTELEFCDAHQLIINEDREHTLSLIKAKGLVLTLRQVSGAFPGLEAAHPNLKKFGIGSVSRPLELRDGDVRHDLYVTLEDGQISSDAIRGRDPTVEIIVEACGADGRLLLGSSPHKSCVYYHTSSPKWNETVRFDMLRLKDLHSVNFIARHVGENGKFTEIGSASLRVQQPDGSLVSNGPKQLTIASKGSLLGISTLLVSSKYSANIPLMALINWKTSSSSISDVLIKCTLLDKSELIKFHKEIFESIMEIMELLPDVSAQAFTTLCSILASAVDGGQHGEENDPLQRTIETFLLNSFSNPRAHYVALDRLTLLAESAGQEKGKSSTRAIALAIKALPYLLRLIIKSRSEWTKKKMDARPAVASVFNNPNDGTSAESSSDSLTQGDHEFKAELCRTLMSLCSLLSIEEPQFVGVQTKLIRTLPVVLSLIEPIYLPIEQQGILEHFLDSVTSETSSLGVDKLLLLEAYLGTPILPNHVFLRHLKTHLRRSKEEKLHCIRLLSVFLRPILGTPELKQKLEMTGSDVMIIPVTTSPSYAPRTSVSSHSSPQPISSGSGRIKIKQRDTLESFHRDSFDSWQDSETDSGSAKDTENKKTSSKDKLKEKDKSSKDKKPKSKESRSDSGSAITSEPHQAPSKDYEADLRDRLLAGKQKRINKSAIVLETLSYRAALKSEPRLRLWALLIDLLPALTRVLCNDMSATALGASNDDEDRVGSARVAVDLNATAVIDQSSRLELMTVITTIINCISSKQIKSFFKHVSGSGSETKLIKSMLEGCLEMVGRIGTEQFNFPMSWPRLVYLQLRAVVRIIYWLEAPIRALSEEPEGQYPQAVPTFNDEQLRLWCRYQRLIIATIQHPALQEESYANRASVIRQLLLKGDVDVRLVLLKRLLALWRMFEAYQIALVGDVVVYLLSMALSLEKTGTVRKVGLMLYWNLLLRDAGLSDDFKFSQVEVRTIQALEELSRSSQWREDALRRVFDSDMKQFVKQHVQRCPKDGPLHQRVTSFVSDMQSLLTLLSELRGLPSGPEYEEERAFALTQLMSYLRQTQHGEAYVKYAHKLSRMYEEAAQFVEAGIAVLLHANSLDWSSKLLSPVLHYPSQISRERKMILLHQALTLLEKGRAYEQAIDVIQQLVLAQKEQLFDYYQLSSYLRMQADLYERIMEEDRFFSNYFFVYYFGSGFPKALRKKAFIYRGLELERIPNFIQRMSKKFPQAEIFKSTEPIADHDRVGQFMQIFTVHPSNEDEMYGRPRPVNADIPERIQKYHQANGVRVFYYSRPFRKDKKEKDENEFASLWISKNYCVVAETFPNIQRRLEIVEKREVILSPIENAVEAVASKNAELADLYSKFSQPDVALKVDRLSMALNGVLDAAVNGGTAKYQSAFLVRDFKEKNPDKATFITKLKALLVDQVRLLGQGLSLHAELVPDSLLGLHAHLEGQFYKLAEQTGGSIDPKTWYRPVGRLRALGQIPQTASGVVGSVVKSASRTNLSGGSSE